MTQPIDVAQGNQVEPTPIQQQIMRGVLLERARQDKKFGEMPRNHAPEVWVAVLCEELGEIARAAIDGDSLGYVEELRQVAAVAIAALEDYYTGEPKNRLSDVCEKQVRYF